jgi:hypothetical protein
MSTQSLRISFPSEARNRRYTAATLPREPSYVVMIDASVAHLAHDAVLVMDVVMLIFRMVEARSIPAPAAAMPCRFLPRL